MIRPWHCLLMALLILTAGCGTLPNGRGWGQDATIMPGWDRVKSVAWATVSSPHVWAPAGGALLFQIDHADERLTHWAAKNTPLFGSNINAARASDTLMYSSFALLGATALATPSGENPTEWTQSKLKGLGSQFSAIALTDGATDLLKVTTGRTRPDGTDQKSLPSGHVSATAVNSMLAYRNTDYLLIPDWSKTTLQTGFVILPYATGWARMEAGKHYPSDSLVGIALGNFFGMFINDAFLGVDSSEDMQVVLDYLPGDTVTVGISFGF